VIARYVRASENGRQFRKDDGTVWVTVQYKDVPARVKPVV